MESRWSASSVTEAGSGNGRPVLGVADVARAAQLLAYEGAGHSVGLHTRLPERATRLGLTLPVCRVIVNQAHCFATGGSLSSTSAVTMVTARPAKMDRSETARRFSPSAQAMGMAVVREKDE